MVRGDGLLGRAHRSPSGLGSFDMYMSSSRCNDPQRGLRMAAVPILWVKRQIRSTSVQ
jgi:hypothetical protein